MAQKPIAMEQLKQLLQLKNDGIAIREMARRLGISRNSVRKYLSLLDNNTDQQGEALTNKALADQAYGNDSMVHDAQRLQQLITHFQSASAEVGKRNVTRQLLWKEYIELHPDGYVYSHYCHHLSQYLKNRDLSMHLEYQAGDMIMVDFAGRKQHYVDTSTDEQISCHVFIAILPYSGLIFCLAVRSQRTADFVTCMNEMLRYYGGTPATILCDNLKTAVTRPDRFEPSFTDMCHQLSEHYATTFSATRPTVPGIRRW